MATVREAVEADLGAIQALVDASWLATYAPLIGETETRRLIAEKHNLPKLRRQLAEPDDVFLVAEADGDILGNVYGFPKPLPNRTQANAFYVDRLHARPDAKGRGIGTALIAACEARLPEGAILWLDVLRGNNAACGFYGARGFVQAGETDCCGGLAGIPAFIMQKTVVRHSPRTAPPLIA